MGLRTDSVSRCPDRWPFVATVGSDKHLPARSGIERHRLLWVIRDGRGYVPRIPRVAPTAKAVHRPVDAPVRGGEQPAALHAAFQVGVDNPLDLGFGTLFHHAPARAAVLAAVARNSVASGTGVSVREE